ncbi:C5a anaphylatoxin chemotactic receptor 1 [Ascaphus truei]|uniref:C5a anaphylatoxin chemotactic receptor 1 n=1 Tax=Ascaphus truei TaxID=8439 RepID=UPI003F59F7C0
MDPTYLFTVDYNYSDYTLDDFNYTEFNNSHRDLPVDLPVDLPDPVITPVKWVALVIYIFVFVLGVPGNTLVVWMTAFEMKSSVNTMWFLNLAIADLLCCLSVPFTAMGIILHGHWPLRLFACKLISSILLVNMYASVLLLTVISMDRCALVIQPVWCQNNRTVKKASLACLLVWLLALLLTSPSFIFRHTLNVDTTVLCTLDYSLAEGHAERVELFIAIFRFLLGFIIPLLIITICYSVLISKVSARFNQSSKTMKVIVMVISGFFVCWFPYHVAGLILAVHPAHSALFISTLRVDPLLVSIAFINSCINPIIYVLVGQDFKNKFMKSIKSVLRNVLADDLSHSFDSRKTKSTSETKNTETHV